MTQSEILVRSILGPCRKKVSPLVYAIDCMIKYSFSANRSIEDIQVTKVIYPEVAKLLGISKHAVARQIERLANDCWDKGNRAILIKVLGIELPFCPPPHEMLCYFAAYLFYGLPFHQAMDQQLFSMF